MTCLSIDTNILFINQYQVYHWTIWSDTSCLPIKMQLVQFLLDEQGIYKQLFDISDHQLLAINYQHFHLLFLVPFFDTDLHLLSSNLLFIFHQYSQYNALYNNHINTNVTYPSIISNIMIIWILVLYCFSCHCSVGYCGPIDSYDYGSDVD